MPTAPIFKKQHSESTLIESGRAFILCLRPRQWSKNLLVFAALIFSINKVDLSQIINSFIGFFLFCLISGSVYILNDFIDIDKDKNHPEKRFRPMASGELHPLKGLLGGIFLFGITMFVSYMINKYFTLILAIYVLINIAYSLKLKNIVILDIMIIAMGFVLRAISGAIVIGVDLTPWFFLCTLWLALFLAASKRRHEINLLQQSKEAHRKVLSSYSTKLLDQINSIVTTALIISYALYTFTSGKAIEMMVTIPLVVYGIFRYLYLIHIENKGGSPEKILSGDRHILVTVFLYITIVVCILFYYT